MAIQRFSNLSYPHWTELRLAIQQLINSGDYKRIVDIHAAMSPREPDGYMPGKHRMHGSAGPTGIRRFLPWHRAYLIVFERALRSINPVLSIPYWDWDADGGRMVGFANLLGLVTTTTPRTPGALSGQAPLPGQQPWFTGPNDFAAFTTYGGDYYRFTSALENGPHNAGHGWIGGAMNTMESPGDPAFWFHHAQIDRIWSIWQTNNPGEMAHLGARDSKLDPWSNEFTIQSVDDMSALGADSYEYV